MKQLLAQLEIATRRFSELTYFKLLEGPGVRSDVEIMARGLSFFVMSFQDVLRLNTELITEPALAEIARAQRKDDAGHHLWFLSDLAKLDVEPDIRWLFGKQHQRTRDTSYEILAALYGAPDDYARLVVALVLEATGGVYFSRVYQFVAKLGLDDGLQFFSRGHWEVEQSHELFEDEAQRRLQSIVLTERDRALALATGLKVFASITAMCDELSRQMIDAHSRPWLEARAGSAATASSDGSHRTPVPFEGERRGAARDR